MGLFLIGNFIIIVFVIINVALRQDKITTNEIIKLISKSSYFSESDKIYIKKLIINKGKIN